MGRRILIATIDASRDEPQAREAIASAVRARADAASAMLLEDPDAMAEVIRAGVEHAGKDPGAAAKRRALLRALIDKTHR